MEKKELRSALRAAAAALSPEYRAEAGKRIVSRVLETKEYASARTVFIYVAMPGEPDTRPLIAAALADGKRVCVPRCREKGRMDAVVITALSDLQPGAYGIPEPEAACAVMEPDAIDLAVIPCMAAAEDGARLGHGGGYYDRFLSETPAYKMCLCFSKRLLAALPREAHDIRMDRVVTEAFSGRTAP